MKKLLIILSVLFFAVSAWADSALQVDFILAGYRHPTTDKVLSGGKIYTFLDGTSTLSALWTDKDKGGSATNPVILDSSGKAEIFGDNIYKFAIYDSSDVLIETLNGLQYKTSIAEVESLNGSYGCDLPTAFAAIGTSTTTQLDIDCDCVIADGTSATFTDNIIPNFVGGTFDGVSGGSTETLNYGEINLISGNYKIHKANLVVTGIGEINPTWRGFLPSETGSNNLAALNTTIDDMATGADIIMPFGVFTVLGQWDIDKASYVDGSVCELDFSTDANDQGILINASNVTIDGLIITGPQRTTNDGTQHGIFAAGTNNSPSAPTYLTDVNIINCKISNWGYRAIFGRYIKNFHWDENTIDACAFAGIVGQSVEYGTINNNVVRDIEGSGSNAYGIATSRNSGAGLDLTTDPASTNIVIDGNVVDSVPDWEGIDTHAGTNLVISNNVVKDTKYGIAVVASNDDGTKRIPKNVTLSNNTILTNVSDAVYGYNIAGEAGQPFLGGALNGGVVEGFDYGIRAQTTTGLAISGVNTYNNDVADIYMQGTANINFSITGNTLGSLNDSVDEESPILFDSAGCRGVISGNFINATNVDYGINYGFTTYSDIIHRDNQIWNYETSAYFRDDRINFDRRYDYADQETVGAGVTTFTPVVIYQDSFTTPGMVLRFSASGIMTDGNTEDKTLYFLWGTTSHIVSNTEAGAHDWRVEVEVVCTSSASQRISWVGYRNEVVEKVGYVNASLNIAAGNINSGFRGQCATGTDIITQKIFSVEKKMDY